MDIEIMKLRDSAIIPTRESRFAAGYDIHANIDEPISIPSGITVKVPTGIATAIPIGHVALIFARSGLATKRGLVPGNAVGVVDADFRSEWFVPLHNYSNEPQKINPGDRIAQVVFIPFDEADFVVKEELATTERQGGFGSTGI